MAELRSDAGVRSAVTTPAISAVSGRRASVSIPNSPCRSVCTAASQPSIDQHNSQEHRTIRWLFDDQLYDVVVKMGTDLLMGVDAQVCTR